jgi:hypothetical protein
MAVILDSYRAARAAERRCGIGPRVRRRGVGVALVARTDKRAVHTLPYGLLDR